jgi:Coenzyme PQQ synthesis protein D (PqqD)
MSVSQYVQILPLTFHGNELGPPMFRVSESVRSTHGQDGAVVLDIRQGQMFNLNFVGSRILELLQAGSAQLQIVDEIVREFGVGRDRAEHDVQEFLQTLKKNRLVEEQAPNNVF